MPSVFASRVPRGCLERREAQVSMARRPSWQPARAERLGAWLEWPGRYPMDVARIGAVFSSGAVLLAACTGVSGGGSKTALIKASDSEATALEYRAAANNLAIRIPGLIELTGDRVLAQTFDPELRRRALLWKLDGTA